MSAWPRFVDGSPAALVNPHTATEAKCLACAVVLQRTPTGSLADGVRAHYKTVHPGRTLR